MTKVQDWLREHKDVLLDTLKDLATAGRLKVTLHEADGHRLEMEEAGQAGSRKVNLILSLVGGTTAKAKGGRIQALLTVDTGPLAEEKDPAQLNILLGTLAESVHGCLAALVSDAECGEGHATCNADGSASLD